MSLLKELEFMQWLKDNGHRDPRPLGKDRWLAIMPLIYTHAIVLGFMYNKSGYEDRWCYHNYESAKKALDAWNGEEPEGWHRHPKSGRRRLDGKKDTEYHNL